MSATKQAVEASRDEYLVERIVGRLKGHPLSLSPLDVERNDHASGLMRMVSLVLGILTVMEGVVHVLKVFQEVTVTMVREP